MKPATKALYLINGVLFFSIGLLCMSTAYGIFNELTDIEFLKIQGQMLVPIFGGIYMLFKGTKRR
ncbi:hypothetical protein [Acinetobacter sp.]|uniref:hypothetical protein n=1 Tax=Acinetobacter sp. TaxID=472 RepID=UPI003CFD6567